MRYYQLNQHLDIVPSQFYLLNHLEPLQEYIGKWYSIKLFFCGFDVSFGFTPQPAVFEITVYNRRTLKVVIEYIASTYEAAYMVFSKGRETIEMEEGR